MKKGLLFKVTSLLLTMGLLVAMLVVPAAVSAAEETVSIATNETIGIKETYDPAAGTWSAGVGVVGAGNILTSTTQVNLGNHNRTSASLSEGGIRNSLYMRYDLSAYKDNLTGLTLNLVQSYRGNSGYLRLFKVPAGFYESNYNSIDMSVFASPDKTLLTSGSSGVNITFDVEEFVNQDGIFEVLINFATANATPSKSDIYRIYHTTKDDNTAPSLTIKLGVKFTKPATKTAKIYFTDEEAAAVSRYGDGDKTTPGTDKNIYDYIPGADKTMQVGSAYQGGGAGWANDTRLLFKKDLNDIMATAGITDAGDIEKVSLALSMKVPSDARYLRMFTGGQDWSVDTVKFADFNFAAANINATPPGMQWDGSSHKPATGINMFDITAYFNDVKDSSGSMMYLLPYVYAADSSPKWVEVHTINTNEEAYRPYLLIEYEGEGPTETLIADVITAQYNMKGSDMAIPILAYYEANQLVKISIGDSVQLTETEQAVQAQIDLSKEDIVEESKLKFFVWDGFDNLKPLLADEHNLLPEL